MADHIKSESILANQFCLCSPLSEAEDRSVLNLRADDSASTKSDRENHVGYIAVNGWVKSVEGRGEVLEIDDKVLVTAGKLGLQAEALEQTTVGLTFELAKVVYRANTLLAKPGCDSFFGAWWRHFLGDKGRSTVYRLVAVGRDFENVNRATVEQFELTALYYLCGKNKTEARATAIARAAAGEFITAAEARELVSNPETQQRGQLTRAEKFTTEFGLVHVRACGETFDVVRALTEALDLCQDITAQSA